jgi:imidazolonepropionase-like amidohydrolase
MIRRQNLRPPCVPILIHFALLLVTWCANSAQILPPGFRPKPVGVHALVGGKVVVQPGQTLENGTIIIRDGLIESVGENISVPADARVWDSKGLTIYAGFIEPYLPVGGTNQPVATTATEPIDASSFTSGGVGFYGAPGQRTDLGPRGASYEINRVTPEYQAGQNYSPDAKTIKPLRELGFAAAVIAPQRGIIRGSSALVNLIEANPNEVIVRPDVFQHIAFDTAGDGERTYPNSLMGVIAVVRQSFFDAQHYKQIRGGEAPDEPARADARPTKARPEYNPSLNALIPATEGKQRVLFEPGSALMVDRAARVAQELKLDFAIVSCGQEWRRPDLAKETGATFIVPVNFPTLPKLPSEDDWEQITLDQLRAWDWAAENPALLRQQNLAIALTTYSLADKKVFRKNVKAALERGLSETDALAALTTIPAQLCGVEKQLGTIEPGKIANLTIVDGGGYFDPESRVREVWVDGRNYFVQTAKEVAKKDEAANGEKEAKAKADKEKKDAELKEVQNKRVARSPMEGRGASLQPEEIVLAGGTIWTCGAEGILTTAEVRVSAGKIKLISVNARPHPGPLPQEREKRPSAPGDEKRQDVSQSFIPNKQETATSEGAVKSTETAAARSLSPGERAGVRASVTTNLSDESLELSVRSLHITPGLIDAHSHSMILGGVNEGTLPSTAMVRIGDVVNSETRNIQDQLAGGLTVANLLHGSANPIGGQNQVIKLRDGASPEAMKFAGAPSGIKFALGENVKQSNIAERNPTRFPQSRTGVPTFYRNRFTAAQQYLVAQASSLGSNAENSGKMPGQTGETPVPLPLRRDLELEAIGEILEGKRLIHCHSYRQDEILAFLRVMEEFQVRVGTLQHILEGYKVADEIAKHGAGASTFSDWWAFKFEVYDAIPYAGALMHDRGVLVSFNSDSSDLARRMNTEAAKAVKYGGVSEEEALKFVTINAAKQLGVDKYVGSLEPGKDADFVVWSGHPLDSRSVVLQTWIDGKKYFDRDEALKRATERQQEREALIAKAKQLKRPASGSGGGGDNGGDDGREFFRVALEHEFEGEERHCMDEEH